MTAEEQLEQDLSNYKQNWLDIYRKYTTQTALDEDKALSLENAQF